MTLAELKALANSMGLTPDDVRAYGSLAKKATWEEAIAHHQPQLNDDEYEIEEEDEEEDLSELTPEERERYQIECEKQECWIDQVTGRKRHQDNAVQRYKETFQCPDCDGMGGHTTEIDGSGWETCSWCHGEKTVSSDVLEQWEDLIGQLNKDVFNQSSEELPFEPTHTLIDGEWVETADIVDPSQLPTLKETDERFTDWEPWMIPDAVFSNALGRYSILYFDRWGNCHCKELDTEREWWACYRISSLTGLSTPSTPIEPFTPSSELPPKLTELTEPIDVKENLLRRMAEHGTPPEEIEQLRHEPLDFCTAYLGDFLLTLADSFQELTA